MAGRRDGPMRTDSLLWLIRASGGPGIDYD
jgi:hypothetical protein